MGGSLTALNGESSGDAALTRSLTFEFISDERFRSSLQADYAEMEACFDRQAWKAVYVLAGSIIEALLVDYLKSLSTPKVTPDPLRMEIGKLIEECRTRGVLSDTTANLCSVVRGYRNLIHPGRAVRLAEQSPNVDGATVARALVRMIIDAVSETRLRDYGYTAEQVATKFERDPAAFHIAPHILGDLHEHERRRLLVDVLPNRHADSADDFESDDWYRRLFRVVFDMSNEDTKASVVGRFVSMLKEEAGDRITAYEEAFFRCGDLEWVPESSRRLVVDHVLSRMQEGISQSILTILPGIGRFLASGDAVKFIDPLVKATFVGHGVYADEIRTLLGDEYQNTPSNVDDSVRTRLRQWRDFYTERELNERAATIAELEALFPTFDDDDIPF